MNAILGPLASDESHRIIILNCCSRLGVEATDVLQARRDSRVLVRARQFIAWYLRERYELSFPHIGRLMNRDHTTVIHSVRKVRAALAARERWAFASKAVCWPEVESSPVPLETALDSLARNAEDTER